MSSLERRVVQWIFNIFIYFKCFMWMRIRYFCVPVREGEEDKQIVKVFN